MKEFESGFFGGISSTFLSQSILQTALRWTEKERGGGRLGGVRERERERDRDRDRERETETDRQTDRNRERERESETDRQTDRLRKDRNRQTYTDR